MNLRRNQYLVLFTLISSSFLFQNCRIDQGLQTSALSTSSGSIDQGAGGSTAVDPGTGTTGQNGQTNDLAKKTRQLFLKLMFGHLQWIIVNLMQQHVLVR